MNTSTYNLVTLAKRGSNRSLSIMPKLIHHTKLNIFQQEQLVNRMSSKFAHVSSLRKRLKDKIRRQNLRAALLLHIATFILIALYLQELVSNLYLLDANMGMLEFIKTTKYTKINPYTGNKELNTVQDVGDIPELENWMREVIVNKMLVQSTPYYTTVDGSNKRGTTPADTDPTACALAIFKCQGTSVATANANCGEQICVESEFASATATCCEAPPPPPPPPPPTTCASASFTCQGTSVATANATCAAADCIEAEFADGDAACCEVPPTTCASATEFTCGGSSVAKEDANCAAAACINTEFLDAASTCCRNPERRRLNTSVTTTPSSVASLSNDTANQISIISTREFYGKYLLLWGVRFRQLRVKPIDRSNALFKHACLVHRKTLENFYDIDYSMDTFGNKKYGWLTSTCYPEWSNVLSNYIESTSNFTTFLSKEEAKSNHNFKYIEQLNHEKISDPLTANMFQNTLYNSYPNRGWVTDFLLEDKNVLNKYDTTIKNGKFIDEQTRAVIVEFTVYLPTTGTFSSVRILFETHISGGIFFTPVVVSASFNGFSTVGNLRIITGILLTIINIYNIYGGMKDFIRSCSGNGDFVIYGWDVVEMLNEILMMSLVVSLWNELFIEGDLKQIKTFLKINDQFVDTSSLLRQRRADINTFAINAFLVSIRFAQFFKLSKELKFVWLGVKRSVNNVSRFSVYVILPCLLGSVSSAYIAFGSHIMTMSNFYKSFVYILRLTFKDDSFQSIFKQLSHSVVSKGLIALFLFSVAVLYAIVLFSFLQAIIFESWQSLLFTVQSQGKELSLDQKNEAYFSRYLFGFFLLPFTVLFNLFNVTFWTSVVPTECKRIFGIHSGTPETNVIWVDILDALEECSGKIELTTISFLTLSDTLMKLIEKKRQQELLSKNGGNGGDGSDGSSEKKNKKNAKNKDTANNSHAFHIAVAFRSIEYIGCVWDEIQLETYNTMEMEERAVLDRQLNHMIRTNKRIDTQHLSYGLSREDALAATLRKMEELNPFSQQGFKRGQLKIMMSKLNLLNQQSIRDSDLLCNQLEQIALSHSQSATIIAGIGKDMDGIDPGTTHDLSVAVQVTNGNKDIAMKMNVIDSSSKIEVLEYDSTW